jgi:hypothetical protein
MCNYALHANVGWRVSEDDGTMQVCTENDWTISLTTSNGTGKCRITIFMVKAIVWNSATYQYSGTYQYTGM